MAKTGAIEAPENSVQSESLGDLTEELPLDDENVLAPEPVRSGGGTAGRSSAVVVVIVAAAGGLIYG